MTGGSSGGQGASQYSIRNSIIDCNSKAGIVLGEYPFIVDTIFNCIMKNNSVAIMDSFSSGLWMQKCIIENNDIGIKLRENNKNLSCNKFCDNTIWDIYCKNSFAGNLNIPDNYWCTSNTTTISGRIYDGYDNINLSLVSFTPIDTLGCYSQGGTNPIDTLQCSLTTCNPSVSATLAGATCDTCHNGSATAHVMNGFAPYTYSWNTSPIQTSQTAHGLAPGTYTICIADANGCTACNSIFIDSANCTGFSITAQATNATCNTCNDGSGQINVTGGTQPYNYTWYTSPVQLTSIAVSLSQGTYSFCVSDLYGCIACDSTVVSIGNCSAHFDLYPDTVLHYYYAVNMASGISPLSYLWNWGDGTYDSIPYPSHSYTSAGFYTICLTIADAVGCTNTYCNSFVLQHNTNALVYVNVLPNTATGITATAAATANFSLFPNPATDQLNIQIDESLIGAQLNIYSVTGALAQTVQLQTINHKQETGNLPSGVYIAEIKTRDASIKRRWVKM